MHGLQAIIAAGIAAGCGALGIAAAAEAPASAVTLARVDALERVFPDREAAAAPDEPVSVPRGGSAAFQFAARAPAALRAQVRLSPITRANGVPLAGMARVYELLPVHVEANTQGSMKTRRGGEPPAEWKPAFVREAPFDVAEVLAETREVSLAPGRSHALLVDVAVARDAVPGDYSGHLIAEADGRRWQAPFALRVHRAALPERQRLHAIHWLDPQPGNLAAGPPAAWWSEEHWRLLERAGRVLRAFGQDCILTPLVNYPSPLIQVTRRADGAFAFDYTRFDRWAETFFRLGFARLVGQHSVTLPRVWGGVFVRDERTGKSAPLLADNRDTAAWLEFLPVFYRSLHQHLEARGWTGRYLQHQLDEPKDADLYRRAAALLREHMPGVRGIDAVNSSPQAFSPLVDTQVFALQVLEKSLDLARERKEQGRASWLYHCTSPYPPYPNRHLDRPLAEGRLYPWLCYQFGVDGFLYWAANLYRGADEYRTSIGPLPNGSQDPGHPPGDAWMFYRGPEGLRPSLRMVAFRDGMQDHALLCLLSERDTAAAERIASGIARSVKDYRKDPPSYHAARRALLEALDGAAPAAEPGRP